VNRAEEIRGPLQIFDCQFKEESLARFAFFHLLANGVVAVVTFLDEVIEDCGIRGNTRDR